MWHYHFTYRQLKCDIRNDLIPNNYTLYLYLTGDTQMGDLLNLELSLNRIELNTLVHTPLIHVDMAI